MDNPRGRNLGEQQQKLQGGYERKSKHSFQELLELTVELTAQGWPDTTLAGTKPRGAIPRAEAKQVWLPGMVWFVAG